MKTVLFVSIVMTYAHISGAIGRGSSSPESDCQPRFYAKKCPVNVRGKCYRMFTRENGAAYTTGNAASKCEGLGGHLANVLNQEVFDAVRCYIVAETSLAPRDQKVLLGMKYDTMTQLITTAGSNGERIRRIYWNRPGVRNRRLRYGSRTILLAGNNAKILNFGGDDTRFDRILCEYPPK